jgi:hypothetical protein
MIYQVRLGKSENAAVADVQWTDHSGWVYRYEPTQAWRRLQPHMYHARVEQTLAEFRAQEARAA